eukprot:GFUD01042773.1.p1 GENE.GFUD01042773.1~~GFUD01042773.1.p1  ORF type:complete len:237 (-),score=44.89 GFUD01042773.1:172-849(-)
MAYQWLATLALAVVLVNDTKSDCGGLMKTGFPDLGIPKVEPLYIDAMKSQLKNAWADVVVDFTDTDVSGLSQHDLIYIKEDKAKKTVAIKIFVPDLIATGNYAINGKFSILNMPFSILSLSILSLTPSPYRTEIKNTTMEGVAQLEAQNGTLVISGDPDISIQVGGHNIKMENLFGGKAGDLDFLSQTSDEFIKDLQPQIAKSLSGFMKGFYNGGLANIHLDTFE